MGKSDAWPKWRVKKHELQQENESNEFTSKGIAGEFHRLYAGIRRTKGIGGVCRDRLPSQSDLGARRALRGKSILCAIRVFDH